MQKVNNHSGLGVFSTTAVFSPPISVNMGSRAKVNLIFGLLAGYILLQFLWWAYLLWTLNADYYTLKQELLLAWGVEADMAPAEELRRKHWMVIGEGMIFLSLLIIGILLTARYMKRDIRLAQLQRNFLLSVSHELKTPIAATKLYLQTLKKRKLEPAKEAEYLDRALKGNDRLEALVEKIILATRLEHSNIDLKKSRQLLEPFVRDCVATLTAIDEGKHKFSVEIESGIAVMTDSLALETMIINLLENAVKYSPAESEIIVRAANVGHNVEFSVTNPGSISVEDQKHVFDKFFRAGNEETRTTKGTGVGLYLVKELAILSGGGVNVNVSGQSVKFSLELPVG
ncbi:MAG: sensor histidine kinase [Cryomorphaceae bacterium]|nr:MAG: sensor histidine kinase [Cryomorphaceae bacterium]